MSGTEHTYHRVLAYLKGLLSNRERHELERGMMRDVFDEEAFEGLSRLSGADLEADMEVLADRLEKRIHPAGRWDLRSYYRIAAGILLLAGLGSILYLVLRKPAPDLITQELNRPGATSDSVARIPAPAIESAAPANTEPRRDENARLRDTSKVQQPALALNSPGNEKKVAGSESAKAPVVEITMVQEPAEDEVAVMNIDKSEEPRAAATAPAAEKKASYVADTSVLPLVKAVPPGGNMRHFRNWVDKNLDQGVLKAYPGTFRVRVDLFIQPDGHIRDIRIRDSLPESLAGELKRILLQSPPWNPALRNNTPVESLSEIELNLTVE